MSSGELYLSQNSSQLFYGYTCKSLDLSNIRTDDIGVSDEMFKSSIIGDTQGKDKLLHSAWCDYYDVQREEHWEHWEQNS